jgi:hypothetical protein
VPPKTIQGRRDARWGCVAWTAPLLIGVALVSYFFWPFRFSGRSICDTCAMTQRKQLYQLPLGFISWRTVYQPEQHTLLSQFLTESGAVGPHPHTWVFIQGAGNGIM